MDWPIYFKDKLIIGDEKSEIGIVTLWTQVTKIVEPIDKSLFSLAGQLYSKEGINFILRNVLANPNIRYLIVCGEERNGSGQALINFLEKGVDSENNVLETEYAQIHKEIPLEAIEAFRKNVKICNMIGNYNTADVVTALRSYQSSQSGLWGESQVFPEPKIEFDGVMPTDQSIFKVRRKFIGMAWLELLKLIMKFGTVRESFYGNNCRELFNIASVITDEDPDNFMMFPYFQITKEDIIDYLPKFMTGEKGTADYTYGERLWNFPHMGVDGQITNQIDDVIVDYLTRYPTDRAACATIFNITDHKAKTAPCMTFVQATNVDGKLDLTAYFRSHDIFGGWLLNAFGLRTLQKYIAGKLGWQIGNLTILSNCAHIYDNNWKLVQELIEKYGQGLDCASDPRGHVVISTEGEEIVAKHLSPNGKPIQEFRQNGKDEGATMKLYNKMVLAEMISQVSHSLYVGSELQKAEIAIKEGKGYIQDRYLQ